MKHIGVIGGGAAGLMFACLAAANGNDVTLFEKNRSNQILKSEACFDNAYLGKKLLITGKGRCNVTNACDRETFFKNVTVNPKFLYAAYAAFDSASTVRFFEERGTRLKTERGSRVFPETDKALTILRTFKDELRTCGVKVLRREIISVEKAGETFTLHTDMGEEMPFDVCVVATGGLSYPVTGSTGDGYAFAKTFGHSVKDCVPSLVPLEGEEAAVCREMCGLSLKNVTLTVTEAGKKKPVFSEMGEMLFTHFGVSGPLVLSASAHLRPMEKGRFTAHIDLKPALDEKTVETKLLKLFEENPNKNLSHVLGSVLPKSMTEPMARAAGLSPDTKPNGITKEQRRTLAACLKDFRLAVTSFRPIDEAIITSGGVNVREIDPHTMMSKLVDNLYFIGEVLDLDAYTGGFNLQIAFSTAAAAARAVSADT